MSDSALKRKTRIDKYPLTLHPTGQYCKKIRGRIYYFGTDKQEAHQRYLEQAALLHAGRTPTRGNGDDKISIKTLCNLYLQHQETRVVSGEITQRYLLDQIAFLRALARYIGPNRTLPDISTIDLQNFKAKLVREKKSPRTVNNHISALKAMFHWGQENEVIGTVPNLKAIKKVNVGLETRPTFSPPEVHLLLKHASVQLQAMIWLGLNCGFGCTDCAELRWEHVDADRARVNFPRPKTGIERNLPLWKETIEALGKLPRINERVFNTHRGNPWVRVIEKHKNKERSLSRDFALSKEFCKLMRKAGMTNKNKGVGFYTLRRTAATWTARSGDPFAVQKLLGHKDLKMASTYVQDVTEQTDRAINSSRHFIVQDNS